MFVGILVERSFDQAAIFVTHAAMKGTDALILLVGTSDQGFQLLFQIAFGIGIFREDQDPFGQPSCTRGSHIGAEIFTDPGG